MRSELDSLGALAALVLIGIALVHAVVPFPAEFPTAAAGFVFGFAIAFPLMVLAWTRVLRGRLPARARRRAAGARAARRAERMAGRRPADRPRRLADPDRRAADPGRPVQPRLLRGRRDARPARALHVDHRGRRDAADGADRAARARLQEPRFDDPVLWLVLLGVLGLLALARPVGRRLRASQP